MQYTKIFVNNSNDFVQKCNRKRNFVLDFKYKKILNKRLDFYPKHTVIRMNTVHCSIIRFQIQVSDESQNYTGTAWKFY